MKKDHYNVKQPNVTHSDGLFYSANSSKPKDIQSNIIYDKENHKILTSEKLEPVSI